ncbi:MAG TPA: hypothetical protein PK122_02760 [Candidatus Paceibacterota bacterium]|nr:hypothetical protein [Candidatus Paceibacterota bacterium]
MLVCETLEQFLNEWIDPAEDRWANRQIDLYLKRKQGINPNEDPEEILSSPRDLEVPHDIPNIKRVLFNIIGYLKNKDVTPQQFLNFCIWATRVTDNPAHLNALLVSLADQVPAVGKELSSTPDGGKYGSGLEYIISKLRGEENM